MVANILLFNPKGMAAKGAGAPAERGDRVHHFHHREEVVATTISRRANHYRSALRTSSDMHPYHYWFVPISLLFVPRTSSGLHHPPYARRILPSHSSPRRTPRRKG